MSTPSTLTICLGFLVILPEAGAVVFLSSRVTIWSSVGACLTAGLFATVVVATGSTPPTTPEASTPTPVLSVPPVTAGGYLSAAPDAAAAPEDPTPIPDDVKASYLLTVVSADTAAALAKDESVHAVVLSSDGTTATVAFPQDQSAKASAIAPGASFEQNTPVTTQDTQTKPPAWGLDRIDSGSPTFDARYTYDSDGSGTRIYVVDTGIYERNADFSDGWHPATPQCSTVTAPPTATVTAHMLRGSRRARVRSGQEGHAGAGAGARLQGRWIQFRCGDRLRLDLQEPPWWACCDQHELRKRAQPGRQRRGVQSCEAGFVVVAAAGNDSADACAFSPAGATAAITVASAKLDGSFASDSNWGPCVDINAPGVDITSDYLKGITTMSGTSMASPHVAGEAARILQTHPRWKAADVLSYLRSVSPDNTVTGAPSGTTKRLAVLPSGSEKALEKATAVATANSWLGTPPMPCTAGSETTGVSEPMSTGPCIGRTCPRGTRGTEGRHAEVAESKWRPDPWDIRLRPQ